MILHCVVLIGMTVSFVWADQQEASQNHPIQINVNNNFHGSSVASASGEASNTANARSEASAQSRAGSRAFCCRISRIMDQGQERFEALRSLSLWSSLNERCGTIMLCGVCAVCLGIFTKVKVATFRLLDSQQCWSLWRGDLANTALYVLPERELIKELVASMQRRYTDTDDIENSQRRVPPSFFRALDEEADLLKRYQWWYAILSTFYLAYFFDFNKSILDDASSRLERIQFLRAKFSQLVYNSEVKKYTSCI